VGTALRPVLRALVEDAAAAKVGGVFDATALDSDGQAAVRMAVERSTFDWSRLSETIEVRYKRFAEGLVATAEAKNGVHRIYLSEKLKAAATEKVATIVLEEAAHHVDHLLLNDRQRKEIFALVHGGKDEPHGHGWDKGDYWDQVGETFMAAFVLAYSDFTPDQGGFTHKVTPAMAEALRRIIG
jgi:hypothetical protein